MARVRPSRTTTSEPNSRESRLDHNQAQGGRVNFGCVPKESGDVAMMKSLIVAFVAFLGLAAFTSDANAVVCARGVYRAGCVGPRGAVVRHGLYYRHPYYRRGVVVRPYYHRGVVVRRRYW
jgi:hypothetical protein